MTAAALAVGCSSEEQTTWDKYRDWREFNQSWLADQQDLRNPDGTPYYKVVVPDWNPGVYVLVHYFNDRTETAGNLSPLYTSTVDVRYEGRKCNGKMFDSSTDNTTPAPGIFRVGLNKVINGWTIALTDMRVGDTAQVVIPYGLAYGQTGSMSSTDTILPYSNLQFNIRLVDIVNYETGN